MILTVGHSNRSLDDFVGLLATAGVGLLADIRRFPRSRSNPQFNEESLGPALAARGICYRHLPTMGGRRSGPKDRFWRDPGFAAYAAWAEGPEFQAALAELRAAAAERPAAIMCAEALWWQCHRRIVADWLLAAGEDVRHIMGPGKIEPASPTPGAVLDRAASVMAPQPRPPSL